MIELIGSILLVASSLALGYLLGRKIPALLLYPRHEGNLMKEWREIIRERIVSSRIYNYFASPEMTVQRILSRVRVLMLRAESRTGSLLERMRRRTQDKKENGRIADSYWQGLKKKGKESARKKEEFSNGSQMIVSQDVVLSTTEEKPKKMRAPRKKAQKSLEVIEQEQRDLE
ncbi:MAG: hypothetical protein Q8P70_00925 [bacterium]|nr:hypothetical protein [bacterium]